MKLRPFELALVIIFIVLLISALILLANYSPKPKDSDSAVAISQPVTIWGTLPPVAIKEMFAEAAKNDDSFSLVRYSYYDPEDLNWQLVNALADGVGPDLLLVSQEQLAGLRNRLNPISYESYPLTDIRSTYIDGAEIFALQDGMYAMPVAVDPLVLYWNRDILSTAGYLEAPATWEQLVNRMFPDLIQRDFNRTIQRSVVAMGEYHNVRNAFGAISLLLIQGGSRLVTEESGKYSVLLSRSVSGTANPLMTAASFYTSFAQPGNTLYSWNRAQPEDRAAFVAEDLAFYFGYASEGHEIQRLNPNLNFSIAEVPQGEGSTVRRTYGRFYGLMLLRSSDNAADAQRVMYTLGGAAFSNEIALDARMVPVHRANIAIGSNDIFGRVAYLTAPVARGWLNPNLEASNAAFTTMVGDINENRAGVSSATSDAVGRLELAY